MGKMRKIKPKRFPRLGEDVAPAKEKTKLVYPKFRIDLDHLPGAKKWDIDTKKKLTLEVQVKGVSNTEYDKSVEFAIMGIKVGGNK